MKKLKLRQVTDHHLNSGIGRYSFELSKALRDLGHDTRLSKLYKKDGDDTRFDRKFDWIDQIHYRSLRDLHPYLLPYFIGTHLLLRKADIYHAHWFMAGLGLIKAGKKKKVITMHDVSLLHEMEQEGKFVDYYRNSLNRFAAEGTPIIVVSESAKRDAMTYSNLREEQLFPVYNGINFQQFFPKEKSRDTALPFQLVYAGGLSPRKNLELLLHSCAILESRNIDYQLHIAGNHPDRTPYPKQVKDLKLKNVKFCGFIADEAMNDFYNQADLFVYASKYEGFGFATLEAMAAGIPVLTTSGGSLGEVSGGGAQVVDYDAEAFAEAIISLIQQPENRKKLASKGAEWVKQYTWKNCAENTLKVYQTISS